MSKKNVGTASPLSKLDTGGFYLAFDPPLPPGKVMDWDYSKAYTWAICVYTRKSGKPDKYIAFGPELNSNNVFALVKADTLKHALKELGYILLDSGTLVKQAREKLTEAEFNALEQSILEDNQDNFGG